MNKSVTLTSLLSFALNITTGGGRSPLFSILPYPAVLIQKSFTLYYTVERSTTLMNKRFLAKIIFTSIVMFAVSSFTTYLISNFVLKVETSNKTIIMKT